jgi:uncharacterized membrane protein required for colicin V production
MNWFDVVAILLVLLVAWLESLRGFGRAIFDFVGALIALRIAIFAGTPLATAVPFLQPEAHSEALWMGVTFVLLTVLIIIATKYIYETTLLSLDVLDPIVGGLLGLGSGIIVAHLFMRSLLTAYAGTDFATVVLNSFMGQELITVRTYHIVVQALQNLGNW